MARKTLTETEARDFFDKIKNHFLSQAKENGRFHTYSCMSHSFSDLSCNYEGGFHDHVWEVMMEYSPVTSQILGYSQVDNFEPRIKSFSADELEEAINFMSVIIQM